MRPALLPLLLLIACSAAVPPPAPTPTATPATAEPTRYVIASRLNLRAAPDAAAARLGQLAINSPVAVLGSEGGFAQVRAGNGTTGWVGADFLAEQRLTLQGAIAAAEREAQASGVSASLAGWQRAAAIDGGDRGVLRQLAEAYEATGDAALAERVRRRLRWPAEILPVAPSRRRTPDARASILGSAGPWQVERGLVGQGPIGPLSPSSFTDHGVAADESWWVLPAWGPAVSASVVEHRIANLNECGGTLAVVTVLSAELGDGNFPLAATSAPPPASWNESTPTPARPRAEAEAVLLAALSAPPGPPRIGRTLSLWPEPEGWRAEGSWTLPLAEQQDCFVGDCGLGIGRWWLPDGGEAVLESSRRVYELFGSLALPSRDLDGDGRLEQISADGCATRIRDHAGEHLSETVMRCCGC